MCRKYYFKDLLLNSFCVSQVSQTHFDLYCLTPKTFSKVLHYEWDNCMENCTNNTKLRNRCGTVVRLTQICNIILHLFYFRSFTDGFWNASAFFLYRSSLCQLKQFRKCKKCLNFARREVIFFPFSNETVFVLKFTVFMGRSDFVSMGIQIFIFSKICNIKLQKSQMCNLFKLTRNKFWQSSFHSILL